MSMMKVQRGSRIEALFTKVTMALNKKNNSVLIIRPVEKKNNLPPSIYFGGASGTSHAL